MNYMMKIETATNTNRYILYHILPVLLHSSNCFFFFFNDTATTEIYTVYNTLSLHDALPICRVAVQSPLCHDTAGQHQRNRQRPDRSEEHTSELQSLYTISYAVFCLKKK